MKRRITFLTRASMMLFAVFFCLTGAKADEFTVYADSAATSQYVPVEGYWADSYQKCEFVIAQAELTELSGDFITQMTFYLPTPAGKVWGGNFQVFVKEVSEATIDAYSGTDDATIVYEGPLDGTGSTMTINFNAPYTYNGGNLLVGVYQIVKGTYSSAAFAGATVEGASIQGHSKDNLDEVIANQKNFVPKTTFTYFVAGALMPPSGLKVNYDGGLEATISWTSDENLFDIDVNDVVTENITDNPYTLTGLDYGTAYTVKVRAKRGEEVSDWSSTATFTTEYAAFSLPYYDSFEDGIGPWTLVDCNPGSGVGTGGGGHESDYSFMFKYSNNPPQYLISPEFDTTAPIDVSFWYKAASANWPETFQVGYSATTKNVDAFSWEDEMTATDKDNWTQYQTSCPAGTKFVAIRYNSNDMYYLYVDDFAFEVADGFSKPTNLAASDITKNSVKLSWTEKGTATAWVVAYKADGAADFTEVITTENPFILSGLTPETEYTVKVRQAGENDKWSDEITFTTAIAFPAPTDLAVVPAAKTAEISWTGNAEATGYNLRYKESGAGVGAGGEFVSDFEDSSFGEWTTIDADGDGYNWVLGSACGGIYLVEGGSLAGSGNGGSQDFVVSGSYSNAEGVGALSPDNWLVSPLVTLGGSISFYAGGQDATYANEYFGVFVSTTSNTDPAAFTQLDAWTLNADGTGTRSSRRKEQGVWGLFTVDLSEYAGQTGYVAIRHFNCSDQFMLNIDDITIVQPGGGEEETWTVVEDVTSPYTIEGLTPETKYQAQVQAVYSEGQSKWAATSFTTLEDVLTPSNLVASDVAKRSAVLSWTENGDATAWELCVNDDEVNLIPADSNPFILEGLTPETEYTVKVRAIRGKKKSRWSDAASFTTGIAWPTPTDLAASKVTATTAEISWTTDADATGAELQWAEGDAGEKIWYKYDNGTVSTSVGMGGGTFQWGVMFPAGSYTGNTLSKVSVFDSAEMTGTVTIYNDGDTAPENAVTSVPVTFTGAAEFIDVEINATIDASKNVWVIINNESGAGYPAACSDDDLGDANGRWVELSGSWLDLANAGISGKCFMIRAEIGSAVDPSTLAWTTVEDATSPFELTGLKAETSYAVRVKSIYGDGESKWTLTSFTTLNDNPVPFDIAADLSADGATLTWEGEGESYNVQYRTPEAAGAAIFEDDFGAGLDQWTIVTAGEGPGWVIGTETGGNAATAYSWQSGSGSYNADNWLISPAVELGGVLKFTVATATSYPDSYEVLLSTTGTEIADFTETLQAMAAAAPGEVTIDLSAYAGQTGHIAIHHVGYDCYLLAIDDFGVYTTNIPASEWENMAVTEKTATISGLATNNLYEYRIQSVNGSKTSEWSAIKDFALLTLDSDADNYQIIDQYNGKFAHVTLAGRTFFKDNKWNTIYLPFNLTLDEVAASPLGDADIRTLKSVSDDEDQVTLYFTAEGEALTTWSSGIFYGGVPYIVKWDEGSNIVNPEFANVTITNEQYYVGNNATVMFTGTYAPMSFDAEDPNVLFIGEGNRQDWPSTGAKIDAFHGYFWLTATTAEYNASDSKPFVTNLEDVENPVGISEAVKKSVHSDWYDLSGRKLAGKPTMKGIYVNKGRKVSVK